MDVAENSIVADASLIKIMVETDTSENKLKVTIEDDGCGMNEEQVASVVDPFFTSRTTRKVGLGIPFFKQAAELTGGFLNVDSEVGVGTKVEAVFLTDSIDCMPLGNICDTIFTLVTMNSHIDFVYEYKVDDKGFVLDTREMKEILGDVGFDNPEVSDFIRNYLYENEAEVKGM